MTEATRECETIYPPEQSMSGKNAHYHPCDVRGGRPHYGVCLFTIEAFEENRLNQAMEDCAGAIKRGECAALRMRQEERDAGRALYYQERKIQIEVVSEKPSESTVDKNSASYKRGFYGTGAKAAKPKRVTPKKPKAPPKSDFEEGMTTIESTAAAITAAANAEVKKSGRQNARAVAAAMFGSK